MTLLTTPQEKAELLEAAVKGRSLWEDARRRLFRNKAAVGSMIVLGTLTFLAIFGPFFWPHDYETIYNDRVLEAPTWEHLHIFGTDPQGRDLFVRLLYGLRMSLAVGLVATGVSLLIGVIWGATAGYIGGRVDQIMMRIVDVLYALPFIFFVIILMVVFGRNLILIFVAIGAVEWLTMARIVRGQT
ncbi:MAG: ABC transporter permease, partial [Hyphomonadaceae bacterium]|uniref:ABC transporter permease n=1 Tax=Aquidulcibacter sp. TaxID=2052990 RepID=UPI0022BAB8A2